MNRTNIPIALILCAGIGLSSWAIRQEGFKIVGAVDLEKMRDAYKLNFPDTPFIGESVRALSKEKIHARIGMDNQDLDLLQISNPCGGVSTSGKRIVFVSMNELFFVCARLALLLKPKAILFENVPGLVNKDMRVLFSLFMTMLLRDSPDYETDARIFNAHAYGDPQSRKRVFIQCIRKDVGVPVWPKAIPISERRSISDVLPDAVSLTNLEFNNALRLPHEPAPTITSHANMQWNDGETQHTLTPIDYARFQSLPDEFQLTGSRTSQIEGIGNGIPVKLMSAITRTIRTEVLKS